MCRAGRATCLFIAAAVVAAGTAAWFLLHPARAVPDAPELRAFVRSRPPVPIIFTSRTEPASLTAAAPEADGFIYPGTIPWAAREGRLRLLDPDGKVYELTWNRPLPDGGTLIDVMSPSVSLDGQRILFAGRKAAPDAGRWRIYQMNIDGRGLKPLTGGPDDAGCIAAPPLRYAADGGLIPDDERRRIDYDDIDPTDLGPSGFAFASSRIPDLGRDHSRRATQIWAWTPGEPAPHPLSANRNNDRWPIYVASDFLVYSLWSRNREAVTDDLSGVRPVSTGGRFAVQPSERWMAARVTPNGAQFGYAVKSAEVVWRPRPLFNGRLAFMTETAGVTSRLRLAQADWGYIHSAPSSLATGSEFPVHGGAKLVFGPDRDAEGRELSAGCPSPCPGGAVLFAAAPAGASANEWALYSVADDWSAAPVPQLLFDDPALVDAEPVAVYARALVPEPERREPPDATYPRPAKLRLTDGRDYTGPAGFLENLAVLDTIRNPLPWHDTPTGERVDPRKNPLVPPPKNVTSIAIYAAHRDRFDDPAAPRVPGAWERLMVVPVEPVSVGTLQSWIPADPLIPTSLVGLDATGKVASWTGTARDATGRVPTYLAHAGDHFTGTRPNGYHYCNGCHTGHTFTSADVRERSR